MTGELVSDRLRRILALGLIGLTVVACDAGSTQSTAGSGPGGPVNVSGSGTPSLEPTLRPSGSTGSADPIPAAGAWQPAAPMTHGRTGFGAVLLGTGEVLAVGDDFACQPGGAVPGSEQAEVYTPNDRWFAVESLNKPRKTPAVVGLPDGSAMVLGGINPDDLPYSSTKVFSPIAHTWTAGPLMEIAVGAPQAVGLGDGRLLAIGDDGAQLYEPSSGRWQIVAPLPTPADLRALVEFGAGKALVIGVDRAATDYAPVAFVFDGQDRWSAIDAPGLLDPRLVALKGGSVLAIGERDGGELLGGSGGLTNRVRRLDPGSTQWVDVAPLPTPRLGAQITLLGDGRVLVAGGATGPDQESGTVVLTTAGLYDPAADRWSAAGDLLEPRAHGVAITLADGSALVLGGSNALDLDGTTPWCPPPLVSVERFVPSR